MVSYKNELHAAFLDAGQKTLQPLYIPRGHGNDADQGPLLVLLTHMAREGQHEPGTAEMKMLLNEHKVELNCYGKPLSVPSPSPSPTPTVSSSQPIQLMNSSH